ncbi:rhomboid-like protein 14, mitochondrial [Malus sylvestris]|uniref:rhomboid-like protein 14, mitochondrial n=1 Tax=Malus sylvestris TaxID=3752 RepID=UPI0021ABDED7|nr:rhomboid-like protein 14, mitochondrial [Malus sylvestris]
MVRGIRRPRSNGMLPLLALHSFSEYYRLDRKPPITAGLIAANSLIYLHPDFLDPILPSIEEVRFNPHLILKYGDLKRFFLSPFFHAGESHLVYNMLSLLWKGIPLESSMDSAEFASMVAVLLGMSQGMSLLISKSLLMFFDYDWSFYSEYSVGFSGVLFAMKVVLNSLTENSYVYGIPIPSHYAVWAELAFAQMLVPGVSFVGHLSGILAGLVYVWLRGSYNGSDPLTAIFRGVFGVLKWPLRFLQRWFPRRQVSGRGPVGWSQRGMSVSGFWRCHACTYENSAWLDVCEMCSTNRRGDGYGSGMGSPRSPHYSGHLTLEELRLRRLERFSR